MVAVAADEDGSIIDVSQWIHQDEIRGNEKKGIKGYAFWRRTKASHEHPVDLLHSLEIINNRQRWAANFMIRLRSCALLRLDVAKMGEILKDDDGRAIPDGVILDGDYIYILDHRLSKSDASIIEKICWGDAKLSWANQNAGHIKIAFRNLVALLDDMYADAREAKIKS